MSPIAVSGVALVFRQPWWQALTAMAALVSTSLLMLVWDGHLRGLSEQGPHAILINVPVVVSALVLHWPGIARRRCGAQQAHRP